jgi:sensor histidine kinase YesM
VFSPVITIKNPFFLTFPGLLLIFLGITGIGAGIIYFTRKISIRKETEKREIEQLKYRAVRGKFIPHFTGNVLNSINYLITKNPESAQRYIADYSDFLHKTLFNSDSLERTIQEELDYAELYLKLEKLRFEEKVEYEFSVNKEVDLSQPVPTMVLHTFCENAIKHGLRPKPKGGKITVRVKKQENCTVISVEDNGVGRAKAKTLNTEGTKEGLKIVQQQIDLFNKGKIQKAHLQIVDLYDAEQQPAGTRVELIV